jgi:hypothetical protein
MFGVMLANTVAAGFMFAIWSKQGYANLFFKMLFLGLFIWNVLVIAKL